MPNSDKALEYLTFRNAFTNPVYTSFEVDDAVLQELKKHIIMNPAKVEVAKQKEQETYHPESANRWWLSLLSAVQESDRASFIHSLDELRRRMAIGDPVPQFTPVNGETDEGLKEINIELAKENKALKEQIRGLQSLKANDLNQSLLNDLRELLDEYENIMDTEDEITQEITQQELTQEPTPTVDESG